METVETRVATGDFLLVGRRASEPVGILEAGSKGWVASVEVVAVDGRGGELEEAEEGDEVEEVEEVGGRRRTRGFFGDRRRGKLLTQEIGAFRASAFCADGTALREPAEELSSCRLRSFAEAAAGKARHERQKRQRTERRWRKWRKWRK